MKTTDAFFWALFTLLSIIAANYFGIISGEKASRASIREGWCLEEGGDISEAGDLCIVRGVVRHWPPYLTYLKEEADEIEVPVKAVPRSVYDMEPLD